MEQSWLTKIDQSDLRSGDLIFYDIPGRIPTTDPVLGEWDHVMTYVGSSVTNIARGKMAAGVIPKTDPYSKNVISTTENGGRLYTGYINLSVSQSYMETEGPGTVYEYYEYYRIDWKELYRTYGIE
jgi:hypothetical protein